MVVRQWWMAAYPSILEGVVADEILDDLRYSDGSVYKRGPVIGEGANSIVYAACRPNHKTTYALKALKKGCMSKAIREIFILKRLAGGPNIIEFHEAFVDGISNLPALVFKIVPPTSWMDISPTFSQEDQKRYSFQVIMALQYAHSKGIIHRDVKPQNIMIDQEKGELRLIDWGVAEVYVPDQDFTVHVGTGYYKPPEILLGQRRYDYSFDMWSVGCVLAAMVFQVEVFFKGTDDVDQLATIVELLGGADLRAYASKSNILMTPEVLEVVSTCRTKRTRLDSLTRLSAGPGTCLLVDLIDRLLQYDPEERLTATEALMHPYFASLSEAHA
ncbi:casein kinase 2, alpha polypeptide [Fimicolochytrium jonesii]|uniref:casein kinase 2, alpha polypeptide n=1 Tax=Fimicolochytrium jonesii TaxID=1396493 RepID=UPI0022FE1D7B|nr:casein kinase 2, alpha polypeptide [Fimicolochytrium jonesii]KAI8826598.1 casein kinase 2, alpha polypeptide [Fimicolochytrium jonesii]